MAVGLVWGQSASRVACLRATLAPTDLCITGLIMHPRLSAKSGSPFEWFIPRPARFRAPWHRAQCPTHPTLTRPPFLTFPRLPRAAKNRTSSECRSACEFAYCFVLIFIEGYFNINAAEVTISTTFPRHEPRF